MRGTGSETLGGPREPHSNGAQQVCATSVITSPIIRHALGIPTCRRGVEGGATPLVCQAPWKVWVANSGSGSRRCEHTTVSVQGPLERRTVVEDPELCAEKEYSVRAERSQSLRPLHISSFRPEAWKLGFSNVSVPLQLTSGASIKSAVFSLHSRLCHKISVKPMAVLSVEEVKSLCSWPSSDDLLDIECIEIKFAQLNPLSGRDLSTSGNMDVCGVPIHCLPLLKDHLSPLV